MSGKRITDLEQVTSVSDESAYLVGTESGDRHIRHKDLVAGIEKSLPIGDMEELKEMNTDGEKLTLVKAILKVFEKATAVFKGTDGVKAGTAGLVPTATPEDKGKVLGAEGKWVQAGSGGGDIDAENVKFSDGSDAETNLGAIKGMTSDVNCENEEIAASAVGLKTVNDKFGGITEFIVNPENGQITGYKTEVGADTVHPFRDNSGGDVIFRAWNSDDNSADFSDVVGFEEFTADEFYMVINNVSNGLIISCYIPSETSITRQIGEKCVSNCKGTYDSNIGKITFKNLATRDAISGNFTGYNLDFGNNGHIAPSVKILGVVHITS